MSPMTSRGRHVIRPLLVYLLAGLILVCAVLWANLLPNIVKDSGFDNSTLTNTRIPLRLVIIGTGVLSALALWHWAHPRVRVPWHQA
jgi:hypothetical protein